MRSHHDHANVETEISGAAPTGEPTWKRRSMIAYASRTGTRRNLKALRRAGWRLLVSATGVHRHEGFRYAIDNGAWTAHQKGVPFDADKFKRLLEALGKGADWIVLPDIVGGGRRSLEFSLSWLSYVRSINPSVLIAVQDGLMREDVAPLLGATTGIFVGGSTDWKIKTLPLWGEVAKDHGCHCHAARVNTRRRILLALRSGCDSFDGSAPSRYAVTLPLLDWSRRQTDMRLREVG